jgi:hypothetical protein
MSRDGCDMATVPSGVAIFLTIRDAEVSSLEGPLFFGATEAEHRDGANFFADHIVDVFAVIDGVPVPNPSTTASRPTSSAPRRPRPGSSAPPVAPARQSATATF